MSELLKEEGTAPKVNDGRWSPGTMNPVPQLPPGASSHAVANPVLLGVTADTNKFKTPSDKLVIVLVGLPARGKTFMGRKIFRYLERGPPSLSTFCDSSLAPTVFRRAAGSSTRST